MEFMLSFFLIDECCNGMFHIMGLFVQIHNRLVFGAIREIGGIGLRGHFQTVDIALGPDLDKDFGVLALALEIVLYGAELVQIMGS